MPAMRVCSGGAVVITLALVCAAALAQDHAEPQRLDSPFGRVTVVHDKAAPPEVRWTLWVAYEQPSALADHATYLADLQSRFGDGKVRVAVIVPETAAPQLAARTPGFTLAASGEPMASGMPVRTALASSDGESTAWEGVDGTVDRLQAALDGRLDAIPGEMDELVQSLLDDVGDGVLPPGATEQCLKALPRSGRARAVAVLEQWWCKGDLAAARQSIDEGLKALAGDSVPLCIFADYVLRGDRTDPEVPKAMAMALAPAAAAAPSGVFTQLVYLRALLRAGQDRAAGRVAAVLPKHLGDDAVQQLFFAETLMDAPQPAAYRDLAEAAIARAQKLPANARWVYATRHKVMTRCGSPPADVDKLVAEYRASDAFSDSLNNDAWYMVTQAPTMGRFDTLALAQCEEMLRQEGDAMDHGNRDTVALVMFVNGRLEQAVELQTVAARGSGDDPRYVGRLTRFENALAAQRAASTPK
jgi:hypothetical protein